MFDDVLIITPKLDLSGLERLPELESLIGQMLPAYEQYVKRFGTGSYSNAVRVYAPHRILNENDEFRARCSEYFFWDGPDTEVSQADLSEAVIIADTLDGDEIVFLPHKKAGLYFLPRHSDNAKWIGHDLDEAIKYICESGQVYDDIPHKYFQSWVDRKRIELVNNQADFAFADYEQKFRGLITADIVEFSLDDEYLSLLSREIEGSISLFGKRVFIEYDQDINLESILATIEGFGYQRV